MKISVHFFAGLKDILGIELLELELDEPVLLKDVIHELKIKFPIIVQQVKSLRYAVRNSYVNKTYELSDGDEVDIIPPVSGG